MFWFRHISARLRLQRGQTFVEYALLLGAIAVGLLLTLVWTGVLGALQGAVDAVISAF
jgi:Flp pilus assembly pilin Flp